MPTYFETAVRYDKLCEDGKTRKVTDRLIVDAQSFTEAEARTIEARRPYISGDFTLNACKRTPIAEIYNTEADRFFLARVAFITIDERTAKERRAITQILIGADDYDRAAANLDIHMQGTLSDWQLISLAETPIIAVITPNTL